MPLAPFTNQSKPGEIYIDENGEWWSVIGWITQPAAYVQARQQQTAR